MKNLNAVGFDQPHILCAGDLVRRTMLGMAVIASAGLVPMSDAFAQDARPAAKPAQPQKTRPKPVRAAPKPDSSIMQARWQEVESAVGPTRLLKLAEQFERDYPFSAVDQQNQALQVCAKKTLEIARSSGISSDFFDETVGDAGYKTNLKQAIRGNKDSAYGLAQAYHQGSSGVKVNARRSEQWLRFAAELDHAKASWELAEIYNREGLMADAARYEKKAAGLGYPVPPRLPNRGY